MSEMNVENADLAQKVRRAKEELDDYVREIVDWHFEPRTGCPFWLNYAKKLDFETETDLSASESPGVGARTTASSRRSARTRSMWACASVTR